MNSQKDAPTPDTPPETPDQASTEACDTEAQTGPPETPQADEAQPDPEENPERQNLIAEIMRIRRTAQQRLFETLTLEQCLKLRVLAEKVMGLRK